MLVDIGFSKDLDKISIAVQKSSALYSSSYSLLVCGWFAQIRAIKDTQNQFNKPRAAGGHQYLSISFEMILAMLATAFVAFLGVTHNKTAYPLQSWIARFAMGGFQVVTSIGISVLWWFLARTAFSVPSPE